MDFQTSDVLLVAFNAAFTLSIGVVFTAVIRQDIHTPPGCPLLRTTSVWKMPPSWHWTGHSGGYLKTFLFAQY